jgi:hypothetical protein
MILGLSLSEFTTVHVIISLIGLVSGFLVLFGMMGGGKSDALTAVFLLTTVLTSVTGFFFPFTALLPSHIVGVLSLVVLAVAIIALYVFHLAGAWRWIYVVAATVALWFNTFVGVVQTFQKIPAIHALAPTQAEPPFLIAQVAVMVLLIVLGIVAVRRFHPV